MSGGATRTPKPKDTTLTPLALVRALGPFDLDPCGYPGHPTAATLIVWPERDGLVEPWHGRVWLNPPYSNPEPFFRRLADHGNGIAIGLASTETGWFQDQVWQRATAVLFSRGRPAFLRTDGTRVTLMRATMLAAYGDDNARRLQRSGLPGVFVPLRERTV